MIPVLGASHKGSLWVVVYDCACEVVDLPSQLPNSPVRLIWLLLLPLFLTGCGGLDFVGSTPPANAPLPAGNPAIEVQFEHPVAPASASAVSVVLTQGDERIPIRVAVSGTGDGLRIEPLVALRPGVEARLLVEPGVAGLGRRRSREAVDLRFPVDGAGLIPMKSKSFKLQGGVGPAR